MFKKIKEFFTGKPVEVQAEAPYKVEVTPAVSEQAVQAVVESIVPAKKPAAKKAPAVKKAPAAKKPRATKVTK